MPNVLYCFDPKITFDLKGSIHKRLASGPGKVQKDQDFIRAGGKIPFRTAQELKRFEYQIAKDADFLAEKGLLDYSLLLGVGNDYHPQSTQCGIIDVLTPFSARKKAEFLAKGTAHGYKVNSIRCERISNDR
jgi:hypothetical protein